MNRRRFIRNIATGTAFTSLGMFPEELLAISDLVTISVLHTNDLHCHIEPFADTNETYNGKGGLARIAEITNKQRQKNQNTLLLDAGDMFQGTPYFNYFKGELMLKVMSAAGYDAGTIGNHEFDNGLEGFLESLPGAKFPIISSNYDFSDTILLDKFQRYKIFRRSGIKIGIYGLGIELKGLVTEKNYGSVIYNEPLEVALEMEKFLKEDQKCDLIICLSHLGHRYADKKISDLVLAEHTLMTDLIIGGHTHTYLAEPVIQKNKAGEPVIVNQAWWGGLMMGKIDFVFERLRKTKKATFANIVNS
jgi:5'-nucleotidase